MTIRLRAHTGEGKIVDEREDVVRSVDMGTGLERATQHRSGPANGRLTSSVLFHNKTSDRKKMRSTIAA